MRPNYYAKLTSKIISWNVDLTVHIYYHILLMFNLAMKTD